ncbi:hypothetical protein BDV59DRAFT_200778 [Aspergillus ambiguus]|uniref:putative isoamyl alcohol oxidase n=1 Tax=Aspergillus ambiguus TaxID=176160 RepID=UPI003CCE33CD
MSILHWALFPLLATAAAFNCKLTPYDADWPQPDEWAALNHTIQGTLIKTAPAASSCYPGNPFGSPYNCTDVTKHWSYAAYHSAWPESVDYSIYTNNSCVPPGAPGYSKERGCTLGALPQYIVNATTEGQIAHAMRWATERNIRIVVKGTGHDLSGRSTGAYSLSIWTRNLNHISHHPAWPLPDTTNNTADVLVFGSGNTWGSIYTAAHEVNRTVVGGEDATVGPGGLIQNGGHGVLSSHYGLASDQVYQATVITAGGQRLVANHAQNQDLFWAIRGAGGGQFGVVTEFVVKTHPVPENIITGSVSFYPRNKSNASEAASWEAFAETTSLIPDLMDAGMSGTVMAFTKQSAMMLTGRNESIPGVAATINLIGFNTTIGSMNATIHDVVSRTTHWRHLTINVSAPTRQTYWAYARPQPLTSTSAGASSLMTSRLLGRRELTDLPQRERIVYLRRLLVSQDADAGGMVVIGLQGGPGPAQTPERMRGSVQRAWRRAYAHVMSYGASVNDTEDASQAISVGAEWYERVIEPVWREWAPNMGAYMNEGNVFSHTWKDDFYGENYEGLLAVKRKYDPSGSLFVWAGVGSDEWEYDLHEGRVCMVE